MVNPKSISNLKRGNKKNTGRKEGSGGKTWQDLILEFGETVCDIRDKGGKLVYKDTSWKMAVVECAYRQACSGNAAILRELMQRSEPQDIGVKLKGEINVFQYETIDRLLASRSSADPSEPSAS